MDNGVTLLIWLFICTIVGYAIGNAKGQAASGLIWGLLLGPIGWIIVLLLPNRKKLEEQIERDRQMAVQLDLQRAQLRQLQQMQQRMNAASYNAPQPSERSFRVSRCGQDIGVIPVSTIKLMLSTDSLTLQDYYFDPDAKDWLPLDCLPDLTST